MPFETEKYYAISPSVRTPGKFWDVVMEKISRNDRVRNEGLHSVKELRNILHTIKRRKAN